jgi:predicted ester cyclase
MSEHNKAAAVRLFTEIFPGGTYDDVASLVHPDGLGHEAPPGTPAGPEGVWRTIQFLRATFEGLSYEIHHAVAESDLVALHCTLHGRQVGPLPGLPPSGVVVSLHMMRVLRFADGKIIEDWGVRDDLDLHRQVGSAPTHA